MSNAATVSLASGTRVSLRYVLEGIRNQTPVLTAIADITTGTQAGEVQTLTRASGSYLVDGFIKGQHVTLAGAAAGDGNYMVTAVTATILTIDTDGATISDGDASNTVQLRMRKLRATGRSINLEKDELASAEVDEDGMESDVRHGFNRVTGSPGFQLSLADYDDIFGLALTGDWVTPDITTTTSLEIDAAGVLTGVDTNWLDAGLRPGDVVRLAELGDTPLPENNGDFFIAAVGSNTEITLVSRGILHDFSIVATDTGATIVYPGSRMDLKAGVCTAMIERAFGDVVQYQVNNGVCVNDLQMNIVPESIIGGSLALLGMSAQALSSTPASALATLDQLNNSPMSAFEGAIVEGGGVIGVATSMSYTLARGNSLAPVIANKFSPDVFNGVAKISGSLTAYFENGALLNKFVNETESSIFLRLEDPDTTTGFLTNVFPRVKYMGGTIDPPQEGAVPLEMPFKALKKTGLNAVGAGVTVNSSFTIQRSNA